MARGALEKQLKEFEHNFDYQRAKKLIQEVQTDLVYLKKLENRIEYLGAVSKGKLV